MLYYITGIIYKMRFFIALEIPDSSREQLEKVQQKICELIPDVRLTDSNKLHLTLAFIGEQPDHLREKFIEVIKNAVIGVAPFQVTPAYIDGFPHLDNPKILWMGVKGDVEKLFIIRERIKDGLVALGMDVDARRYVPHIAIAKTPGDFVLAPEQQAEFERIALADNFEPIQISSLKLFQSIPEEGFHTHNTLAEIPL